MCEKFEVPLSSGTPKSLLWPKYPFRIEIYYSCQRKMGPGRIQLFNGKVLDLMIRTDVLSNQFRIITKTN
jgi:hypothetical protein